MMHEIIAALTLFGLSMCSVGICMLIFFMFRDERKKEGRK